MNRAAVVVAASILLLTGCGSDPKTPSSNAETAIPEDKTVAKVGDEIEAGVYTAPANRCNGFSATTREYDLEPEETVGEFVGTSVLVRDVDRIVLYEGQYFHSSFCPPGTWKREDGTGTKSIDPETIEGACTLLITDRLLADAMKFPTGKKETKADETRRMDIQNRLFSIGVATMFEADFGDTNSELADNLPVGVIVDFLDDPEEYVDNGELSSDIASAAQKIEKACKG